MFDNQDNGAVILRDGTVIGEDFICYADDNYFDYNSKNMGAVDEVKKKIVDRMRKKLKVSDLILEYDLIRLFLKRNI